MENAKSYVQEFIFNEVRYITNYNSKTNLVQSKNDFYCYLYISRVDLTMHIEQIGRGNYLSFPRLRLPWVIPHSTIAILNSSFCFTFAYRSITVGVSPGRIPGRNKHQGNLLRSDAALRRCSRPWPCQWASFALPLSPSSSPPFPHSPLSFSHTHAHALYLIFLFVPLFSSHRLFPTLSFFLRHFLSSFSRSPRATECPSSATCLRCMFSWWHEGLKRRTLLLRSDAASSSRQRRTPPCSRLLVITLAEAPLPVYRARRLSCAFPRSFFPPRSSGRSFRLARPSPYHFDAAVAFSMPPPLPSTDTLIHVSESVLLF